jgi:Protein of unknown function (DUF2500).
MGFSPFDSMMFNVIPTIVTVGFIFVFGMIIASMVTGAKQWKRNNDSPTLTVNAKIVTKRMNVDSHLHHDNTTNSHRTSSSSTYFVTFEVESGDRMEFHIPAHEYGMLVENDNGRLTFQGTRYLGFDRSR